MRRSRRTKVAYERLYDNPSTLLKDCNVILFPNGRDEIWVQSLDGKRSIKITGGDGPAGLGINLERSVGGAPLSVAGNLADDHWTASGITDYVACSVVQYRQDDWSQAFKTWCADTSADYPEICQQPPVDR